MFPATSVPDISNKTRKQLEEEKRHCRPATLLIAEDQQPNEGLFGHFSPLDLDLLQLPVGMQPWPHPALWRRNATCTFACQLPVLQQHWDLLVQAKAIDKYGDPAGQQHGLMAAYHPHPQSRHCRRHPAASALKQKDVYPAARHWPAPIAETDPTCSRCSGC